MKRNKVVTMKSKIILFSMTPGEFMALYDHLREFSTSLKDELIPSDARDQALLDIMHQMRQKIAQAVNDRADEVEEVVDCVTLTSEDDAKIAGSQEPWHHQHHSRLASDDDVMINQIVNEQLTSFLRHPCDPQRTMGAPNAKCK